MALLVYSVLKFMIIGDIAGQPSFSPPEIPDFTDCGLDDCEFREFNPGCSSIEGCLEDLGDAFWNFGLFIIFIFTTIIKLLTLVVLLLVFIGQISVETIPDAPWYVNILLLTPLSFAIVLGIIKLIAKGDEE